MIVFQKPLDELLHLSSLLWGHLVDLQLLHKGILTTLDYAVESLVKVHPLTCSSCQREPRLCQGPTAATQTARVWCSCLPVSGTPLWALLAESKFMGQSVEVIPCASVLYDYNYQRAVVRGSDSSRLLGVSRVAPKAGACKRACSLACNHLSSIHQTAMCCQASSVARHCLLQVLACS